MSVVLEFPVEKEYSKNLKIIPDDIKLLRQWVNAQPHLPFNYITDLDLILAYHSCDYEVEVAKQTIDLNFTLRTIFCFYQNREVNNNIEIVFQKWLLLPLSTPTVKGHRALYCQLLDEDPKDFVYVDTVRAFMMVMDLWQYEEGTVPGVVVILNMDKISLGHLSRVDLLVAQQFFYFLQEAMFVRLKEFHFMNAPNFMDKVLTLFKPFMQKELLEVVHVHQRGANTLDAFMPRPAFPKDAGGENKDSSILRDEIWSKIKANKQLIVDENKKRVNESLRPGNPKTISSIFSGIEHTFKKLDID
ncbi:Alpha-tocopherol transfer protein-like [Eumeta japonica]|uniref:Alpha-tocopherol transfer protein-like n=1 Tax=Eumeta variegata TaxID=151549 RepID=A0A4C1V498_EUMVA|nr:Alpha-tocopherol transfer protein-like [Eumeta japonica]